METKRKTTYISPTSHVVGLQMSTMLCTSLGMNSTLGTQGLEGRDDSNGFTWGGNDW